MAPQQTQKLFSSERHVAARPVPGPSGLAIGWGLFALRPLVAGETALKLDWSDEDRVEIVSWDDVEPEHHIFSIAIAPRWYFYVSRQHPFLYLNHSCNPNLAFKDFALGETETSIPIVALRAIAPGEELSFDYSMTVTSDDGETEDQRWSMKCLCGQPNCRKDLVNFSHLPRSLQRQETLRSSPFPGTVPAFVLAETPDLVTELRATSPEKFKTYARALDEQLRRARLFEAEYDPNEPFYIVGGEPTEL